jgi:hypothetical protein
MGISAKEYQKRLQSVMKITTLREIVSEIILKDEETVKNLKRQDFLEGDIFGNDTYDSYRSRNYEIFKSRKNPLAGGNVDLILTGVFVDAMYLLKPKQGRYKFGNTDKKRNILKEMYGDNIFGLNQRVFEKYQKEIILPRFRTAIKKYAKIQ